MTPEAQAERAAFAEELANLIAAQGVALKLACHPDYQREALHLLRLSQQQIEQITQRYGHLQEPTP